MMIAALDTIAQELGLEFYYGDYNSFARDVNREGERERVILYHEGWVGGPINEDLQGAFEWNYNVKLYILVQSQLADTPVFRLPAFQTVKPVVEQILVKLKQDYILTNIYGDNNINLTPRILDGLSLKFSAKSKECSVLCYPM